MLNDGLAWSPLLAGDWRHPPQPLGPEDRDGDARVQGRPGATTQAGEARCLAQGQGGATKGGRTSASSQAALRLPPPLAGKREGTPPSLPSHLVPGPRILAQHGAPGRLASGLATAHASPVPWVPPPLALLSNAGALPHRRGPGRPARIQHYSSPLPADQWMQARPPSPSPSSPAPGDPLAARSAHGFGEGAESSSLLPGRVDLGAPAFRRGHREEANVADAAYLRSALSLAQQQSHQPQSHPDASVPGTSHDPLAPHATAHQAQPPDRARPSITTPSPGTGFTSASMAAVGSAATAIPGTASMSNHPVGSDTMPTQPHHHHHDLQQRPPHPQPQQPQPHNHHHHRVPSLPPTAMPLSSQRVIWETEEWCMPTFASSNPTQGHAVTQYCPTPAHLALGPGRIVKNVRSMDDLLHYHARAQRRASSTAAPAAAAATTVATGPKRGSFEVGDPASQLQEQLHRRLTLHASGTRLDTIPLHARLMGHGVGVRRPPVGPFPPAMGNGLSMPSLPSLPLGARQSLPYLPHSGAPDKQCGGAQREVPERAQSLSGVSAGSSLHASPSSYEAPIIQEIRSSNLLVDDSILTPAYFSTITTDALRIYHSVGMTFSELDQQGAFLARLRAHLQLLVPHAILRRCGDPHNRTCIAGDEIIATLYDPIQGLRDPGLVEWVNKLGLQLKKLGMKDVKVLFMAQPPMIKFRDPLSPIRIQLFIQSPLVELTANLLDAYFRIDIRAKQLLAAVKYWAKRRGILDFTPMTSDCFVHMAVHLLQRRGVLPCLQSLYAQHPLDAAAYVLDGCNTYYFAGHLPSVWSCQNQESVGELLVAFFKYFATEFPYVHGVASTRVGALLSKEEKGWTKEIQIDNQRIGGIGSRDRFWLCIEDPMDVGFNVCRSVDKEALFEIRGEFIRASKLLCNGTKQPGERIMSKVCEVGGNLCQPISPILLAPSTLPVVGPSSSRKVYAENLYEST